MTEHGSERVERSNLVRVLYGIFWFFAIYLVVQIAVGAVVGAIAGAQTQTSAAGYAAGHAASMAFFQKYGLLFVLAEVALTAWLSVNGVLPGTGKWKNA